MIPHLRRHHRALALTRHASEVGRPDRHLDPRFVLPMVAAEILKLPLTVLSACRHRGLIASAPGKTLTAIYERREVERFAVELENDQLLRDQVTQFRSRR
jgi:hypothetical protein